MRCDLEAIGREGERTRYRCKRCQRECSSREADASHVKMQCGKPSGEREVLKDTEVCELFGQSDPSLIGNQVAEMFKAIGIPPCGGCNKRREWLNRAHDWLRQLAGCSPQSTDC